MPLLHGLRAMETGAAAPLGCAPGCRVPRRGRRVSGRPVRRVDAWCARASRGGARQARAAGLRHDVDRQTSRLRRMETSRSTATTGPALPGALRADDEATLL